MKWNSKFHSFCTVTDKCTMDSTIIKSCIILSVLCIINSFESNILTYFAFKILDKVIEVNFFSLIKGGNYCSIFGGEMQIFDAEIKNF